MNRLLAIFAFASLLTLNLLLTGCGGASSSTATLMSIVVSPAAPFVAIGTTKQFSAMGVYSDNTTKDISSSVNWSSSDITKATIVATTGLATGVALGTTTITATSGIITGNTVLTVAKVYTYTGNVYASTHDYTSCTGGNCANYTAAMKITGSFTTSAPLAANLSNSNIASLVTSYSFTDGINTYASTDSKARIYNFEISTDSSGSITSTSIVLEQWATVATTHTIGDHFSFIEIRNIGAVFNNTVCFNVGVSAFNNISDVCIASSGDSSQSYATVNGAGTWN